MKRMIDSNIFEDEWFIQLKPEHKLFWLYLITKCDYAGLYKPNLKVAEFYIGAKLDIKEIKEIFKGKIIFRDKVWHIPNFIKWQYGNKLNSNNSVHRNVINKLAEEFDADERIEDDKEPTLEEVKKYFESCGYPKEEAENFYSYYSSQNWETIRGVSIKKRWRNKVIGFLNNSKNFNSSEKTKVNKGNKYFIKGGDENDDN